jgi:hypothetical protein
VVQNAFSARRLALTTARGKYCGRCVLCSVIMELKCVHVNTSYSITEVLLCRNTPKSAIEECAI